MECVIREMKARAGNVGVELCINRDKWLVNTILYADDTVLIAKSESELQRLVGVFNDACQNKEAEGECK